MKILSIIKVAIIITTFLGMASVIKAEGGHNDPDLQLPDHTETVVIGNAVETIVNNVRVVSCSDEGTCMTIGKKSGLSGPTCNPGDSPRDGVFIHDSINPSVGEGYSNVCLNLFDIDANGVGHIQFTTTSSSVSYNNLNDWNNR